MSKQHPQNGKRLGSGLVFGKFLPLHEGHIHLMNFAQASVHRLTILVCTLQREPIPGEIRYQWVKEMFPHANVVHHYADIPQEPHEHPDFWTLWHESIKRHCPGEEFDALFGSEDYGWQMAKTMSIRYIPVNRIRNLVPVSGTMLRNDPMHHWQYLPHVVRPYFAKRIRIVGPESTGKSMLTKKLADHYQTVFADEYARHMLDEYVANKGYAPGEVRQEDIETIARGQLVTEDSLARRANRLLFCDTDLLTTVFWSNYYFHSCPTWVEEEAERRRYDLTLLLDTDVPWVEDPQRPMPSQNQRDDFRDWWKKTLIRRGDPFVTLSGNWEERFRNACNAVDAVLVQKRVGTS